MNEVERAAARLGVSAPVTACETIKTGNINRTFHITCPGSGEYIIQNLNTFVFADPVELMENIDAVTAHLRVKYRAAGKDPARHVLNYLHCPDGRPYFIDENGKFWRGYDYVPFTRTYDSVPDPRLLTGAGQAFGEFCAMLSDFDMTRLHETIPDFHNTPKRFAAFEKALAEDPAGRAAGIREETDYLLSLKELCSALEDMKAQGLLPLRVTHNDTKYNNVLIDTRTNTPAAVIDLDTVMPGLSAYDFGDAIRFAANTSAEDERDVSRTSLNLEYYDAFARGYVGVLGASFSQTEIMSLPDGAVVMTAELALRFCTDYLLGDPYFKLDYPEHNIVRTRCQIALVKDMLEKLGRMRDITSKYI